MDNSKVVKLPSGAELRITLAPFADSKALYQAVLEELRNLKIDPKEDIDANLFKDIFCMGFSSKKIDQALNKCFQRVTYNNLKISDETWEPLQAREDYWSACLEVAKENILPFAKSLYAEFSHIFPMIVSDLALRQKTTQS